MQTYRTRGTCSPFIEYEVIGSNVHNVRFIGGCRGNAQGVSRLVEGRPVSEVITLLSGIQCRGGTSCPDQLAQALQRHLDRGQSTSDALQQAKQ